MPRPIIMWRWRQPARTDSPSGNEGAADWRRGEQKKKKPRESLSSLPLLFLINLQVVSSRLAEMIIATAWWPRSPLGCLTPLTPLRSKAADWTIKHPPSLKPLQPHSPANPSWFRAPRKIDTYFFSLLRCSLKCDIINCSSSSFSPPSLLGPPFSFGDLRLRVLGVTEQSSLNVTDHQPPRVWSLEIYRSGKQKKRKEKERSYDPIEGWAKITNKLKDAWLQFFAHSSHLIKTQWVFVAFWPHQPSNLYQRFTPLYSS